MGKFTGFFKAIGRGTAKALFFTPKVLDMGVSAALRRVSGRKIFKQLKDVDNGMSKTGKELRDLPSIKNGGNVDRYRALGNNQINNMMNVMKETPVKDLQSLRMRKHLAIEYRSFKRQVKRAVRDIKKSDNLSDAVKQQHIQNLEKVLLRGRKEVGSKLVKNLSIDKIRPSMAFRACAENAGLCVLAMALIATTTAIGIAVANMVKCGRFQANANACDRGEDDSDENAVATALNGYSLVQRSCFYTCVPTNYDGVTYPSVPEYNTREDAIAGAVRDSDGNVTQSGITEMQDSETGSLVEQPFCSAEKDTAEENCIDYCLEECRDVEVLEDEKKDADKEDLVTGILIAVGVGLALLLVAFLVLRRKSKLPDEEAKMLKELEADT